MASSSTTSPLWIDLPLLWVAVSYLLGALPFAVWVGRMTGRDPRTGGSHNPGASNVARTSGVRWGLLTLGFDAAKGALIPYLILSGMLISGEPPSRDMGELSLSLSLPEWAALSGICGVLGHITSPFLNFKGGRGVATALGAMLALHPGIAGVSIFTWLITLALTRVAAWASLIMSASFVLLSQFSHVGHEVSLFALCAATLITVRHWGHLKRLIGQGAPAYSALPIPHRTPKPPRRGPKKTRKRRRS